MNRKTLMKKVLSIALALVMALSTMVMLVPTASAAETVDPSANGGSGKLYYEEDFNDPALADLVDKDLAAAIGWSAPGSKTTMWIEDGAIRLASQYTPSGVYPPTVKAWGDTYTTRWVRNDDLIKNGTVVEYTLTSYRRPAGSEDITVTTADGTTKTIKADGQGSYQGFGAYMEGWSGTDNYLIRFNPGGTGNTATTKQYDTPSNAASRGEIYWKSGAVTRVSNAIDEGDNYTLEYVDNPIGTEAASAKAGKYYNTEYRIKHIIEPHANRCYTFINGVLFEATNPDGVYGQYTANGWNAAITKYLGFNMKPGASIKLDDISVKEYVPALTISEIMANGIGTSTAKGKYQWVEITNPGDAPVNVYDYALHTCMGNTAKTIGDEVEMYNTGSGSTIGYFTPGAKTLGTEVFDSPSYEEGVLWPGESAIVLMPYTAMEGGLSVTDEAFRAYLIGLGMDETVKTFVADNKSEKPFFLIHENNQNWAVSILKVKNKGTDGAYDPEAVAFGQTTHYINAFAECTAIVTAKTGGGTNFFGLRLYESTYDSVNKTWITTNTNYNNDNFLGHVPLIALDGDAAYTATGNKSFEISYSGWYTDAPHASMQWGWAKYSPTETRMNAKGDSVNATPGFVPVDCRRTVGITTIDSNGNTQAAYAGRLLTESTVTVTSPAEVVGKKIQVFVNGELYLDEVPAKTAIDVTFTAAQMTNGAASTIEFRYLVIAPTIIGIQQSDTNTVRVLAGVNDLDLENDTLGFNVRVNYAEQESLVEYNCKYVYKSVTVSGQNTSAESLGYEHLFVLHITDVPFDELTNELTITVEASMNGESGVMGSQQFVFPAA